MESLNKLFTEDQINDTSTKILKASITKITDELQGKFSQEMESWIYEHYLNSKSKIENDLIKEITEEFIQKPMQYKFAKLREKLFLENKDFLTKTLTDEAIMLSVENVIENYTHRKLTPKECFLLQGFPRTFKLPKKIADSKLYHQAGNSVTVTVVERIAVNIRKTLLNEIITNSKRKEILLTHYL